MMGSCQYKVGDKVYFDRQRDGGDEVLIVEKVYYYTPWATWIVMCQGGLYEYPQHRYTPVQ